jgi:integrase
MRLHKVVVFIRSGAFTVMCRHIELKKNTWYYRRRIPTCARAVHKTSPDAKTPTQVYFSLMTSDKMAACKKADTETRRLDALWGVLRNARTEGANAQVALAVLEARGFKPGDAIRYRDEPPISDFIDDLVGRYEPFEEPPIVSAQDKLTIGILYGAPIPRTLSDAKQKHFELGKGPRGKVAEGAFNRAWLRLIAITGDIPLDQLRREHANRFVSDLDKTGVSGETIRKNIAQIRPLIQTAILEFELNLTNPFDKVTIPTIGEGPRRPRQAYVMAETKAILERCVNVDDERRWAIAMLSETMCRLAEVIGLRKEDVFLEESVPHIWVRPNEVRRLKNKASNRRVPLVGMALWAANRAMDSQGSYLFPIFLTKGIGQDFSSGSASAALGKWLKGNKLSKEGQGLHSFRHTMRDRLRNVETPPDLANRIGGWTSGGVGETYGQGHSLPVMQKFLLRAVEALNGAVPAGPAELALD